MRSTLNLLVNPRENWIANDLDRFVDGFFGPGVVKNEVTFRPAVDIDETDTHYVVSFDVPGVKKEDIKVEFHDGALVVTGERKWESQSETDTRVFRERRHGKFARTVQLPEEIDAEKIEASHADGELRIKISKAEAKKPRAITIQ